MKSKGATKHLKRLAQGGKVPQQSHDRMAPVATMTGVQIPLMPGMLDEFQGHGIEREQTFIPNQSVQGVEPASPGGMARRAQLEQDNSLRPLSYSDQENQTLSGPQNASPPILRRRFDQTQAGASRLGPDDELDGSQGGVPLGELPQNRKRGREQEVHGDYALAGETIENPSFGMDREALDATGRRLISSIQDQSHIDPMLRELTETMDAQHGNWDDMRESDSQAQNPENALEPQSKKEADKSVTQQANERAKRLVALARMNKTPRTRRNWTDAEVEHLIHYVGITGPRYAAIKALATADGILMERNQVDLKDKVRNIKMDYLKGKALLPKNFRDFPLNKKDKQRLVDLGIDYEEANREFGDQDQNDPAVVEGYPGNYDPALEEHETQIRAVLAEVGSQPPEDSRPTPEPTNAPLIEQDASQQHNTQHQLMTQQARDSEGLSPQDLAQAVQEQTARDDAHEQLIAQQRIHQYQIPQEHMQLRQFAPMQATPQSAQRQVKAEHESFHPRG